MSNINSETIQKFYTSFSSKNIDAMLECYAETIVFEDPVFGQLKGNTAKAMWRMLIERSTDLSLTFSGVEADETTGRADWTAVYPFSKTGRTITNQIHAEFTFQDGRIVTHKDHFNLWKWAGMALGWKGYVLGFSSVIQDKIKKEAKSGLELYMKRKKIQP
ncbi:MAG: nuclear transport factor 2 family protein [Leptospiraceae bacterium]|nr:nuclear transport factor 2 family protein [Leptospiraceae bacterium]MCP5511889.1 nuclear transport factor 2 family protein [Leptospiraceae bacterium]